jgi:hypothetical protein
MSIFFVKEEGDKFRHYEKSILFDAPKAIFLRHGSNLFDGDNKLGISVVTLQEGIEFILAEEIDVEDRFNGNGNDRHHTVF